MKLRNEPILVQRDADGDPIRFIWDGRLYHIVRTVETWSWDGKWWLTGDLKGWSRWYYRIEARAAGGRNLITLDICKQAGCWMISREDD